MRVVHFTHGATDQLHQLRTTGAHFVPLADGSGDTHAGCLHLEKGSRITAPSITHAATPRRPVPDDRTRFGAAGTSPAATPDPGPSRRTDYRGASTARAARCAPHPTADHSCAESQSAAPAPT